jgi:hypothetical protein
VKEIILTRPAKKSNVACMGFFFVPLTKLFFYPFSQMNSSCRWPVWANPIVSCVLCNLLKERMKSWSPDAVFLPFTDRSMWDRDVLG